MTLLIFDKAAIDAKVQSMTSTLPQGHKNAIVLATDTRGVAGALKVSLLDTGALSIDAEAYAHLDTSALKVDQDGFALVASW